MQVQVMLFASLREAAGAPTLEVELREGSDTTALLRCLRALLPQAAGLLDRSAVAINEAYAPAGALIRAGDTVALIPPVSGGGR